MVESLFQSNYRLNVQSWECMLKWLHHECFLRNLLKAFRASDYHRLQKFEVKVLNICLHEANLFWKHFFSQFPGNFCAHNNNFTSIKKRSSQKQLIYYNTKSRIFEFQSHSGFLLCFTFSVKKSVNRKLTFIYLSNLNMSHIRSEALTQENSRRKVFLRFLQNSLENNCVQDSLLK